MSDPLGPVRRHVTVAVGPDDAFRAFTERIGEWWPVDALSMAADREDGSTVASIVFEGREGGRLFEVDSNGDEGTWATITAWEPPRRFVLAWKPNLRDELPTEVEVRFAPDGDGTRVDVEHRGWERLGDDGERRAAGHAAGWGDVLARYAAAAGPARG